MTRDDVPIEVIAQFLGTLANGVAFARVTDDPMPDLDQLMTLIETGVAPRYAHGQAELGAVGAGVDRLQLLHALRRSAASPANWIPTPSSRQRSTFVWPAL